MITNISNQDLRRFRAHISNSNLAFFADLSDHIFTVVSSIRMTNFAVFLFLLSTFKWIFKIRINWVLLVEGEGLWSLKIVISLLVFCPDTWGFRFYNCQVQDIRSMGKNSNSNGYLFLTLKLSEIKDSGKQGITTTSPLKKEMSFAGIIFFIFSDF